MIVLHMKNSATDTQALWNRLVGFSKQRAGITYVITSPPSPKMVDILFEQGFYQSKLQAVRAIQRGGIQYRQDDEDVWMIITDKHQCAVGLYRIGQYQGMEVCNNGTIRAIYIKDYEQKACASTTLATCHRAINCHTC